MNKMVMKEQRVENILLSLKKCDYLTRAQIQSIHDLKGDRNANRFINSMSEYLSCFRHGLENVYYLNKRGREEIDHPVIRKKTPQVQHYLIRNQLWIHMRCPRTWENEVEIQVENHTIKADAMFEHKNRMVFVEADVSQPMTVNKRKIEKYRLIQEMSSDPFFLIYVTELESRKPKLEKYLKGLNSQVFTYNEIK